MHAALLRWRNAAAGNRLLCSTLAACSILSFTTDYRLGCASALEF